MNDVAVPEQDRRLLRMRGRFWVLACLVLTSLLFLAGWRTWPRSTCRVTWSSNLGGGGVRRVEFAADERTLAALTIAGRVHLRDAATGTVIGELDTGKTACFDVACHPTAPLCAIATGREVQVWNLSDRTLSERREFEWSVRAVDYSGDGRFLAVAGGSRDDVRTDESESAYGRIVVAGSDSLETHSGPLELSSEAQSVAISTDGRYVAAAALRSEVNVFSVESGKLAGRLAESVERVRFLPEGHTLLLAGRSRASGPRFLNVETNQLEASLARGPGAILDAAISADGERLALAESIVMPFVDRMYGQGTVIDRSHGKELHRAIVGGRFDPTKFRQCAAIALSRDGSLLVTGDADGQLICWRLSE